MKLIIKRTSRDYVVVRVGGEYKNHAHFKRRSGAEKIIKLIDKRMLPNNEYFKTAAKRLLTEEEYNQLRVKKSKPNYVNVQRGIV